MTMVEKPILGTGLLAIWNGIDPDKENEFLRWHMSEHIPERLSIPGFIRARRYRAVNAYPDFFNLYEVDAPEILTSTSYIDRLNNPSDWTKKIVPFFKNTSRILCRVIESKGSGIGGYAYVIRLEKSSDIILELIDDLNTSLDVNAVHLMERFEEPAAFTSESAMRSEPDGTSRTVLIIEGLSDQLLQNVITEYASDNQFIALCGVPPTSRGLYKIDFLMNAPNQPNYGEKQ